MKKARILAESGPLTSLLLRAGRVCAYALPSPGCIWSLQPSSHKLAGTAVRCRFVLQQSDFRQFIDKPIG